MVAASVSLESLCVNSIRMLAVDAVNKSNSGHPGLPMGCAPMGYALWQNILNHNPKNPKWFNRDRFVLSAGHGCMLLYSLLHLTGYKSVSIEDIKEFRQWGSKTPGHPETFETEGVEVTAGPLGAGISNAVGLAIAETHLAAKFNKPDCNIVDHYTYVIMGDGCNQEGIASEACSLAGHLKLGKLIALYDDNQITIDGRTDVSFTEDVLKRYEAYGWHVQHVEDGNHDVKGITEAGLILSSSKNNHAIQQSVLPLVSLFATIFFVLVGAGMDLSVINPLDPTSRSALVVAGFLLIVAIIGKIAAGWVFSSDKPTNRLVVGLGMMPRGEVGLIFLGLGTSAKLLTPSLEAAILLMVIGTTFLAPVLLRIVLKDKPPNDGNKISDDVAADPVGLL